MAMVMVFIYRIFYIVTYSNAVYIISVHLGEIGHQHI